MKCNSSAFEYLLNYLLQGNLRAIFQMSLFLFYLSLSYIILVNSETVISFTFTNAYLS